MSKKLHPETLTATALGWIDRETDAMAFASIDIVLARSQKFRPSRTDVHSR